MGKAYGIEVYQLWPQSGPFWYMDPATGELELFERYEDAVRRSDALFLRDDLTNFSFRAVEYREGSGH